MKLQFKNIVIKWDKLRLGYLEHQAEKSYLAVKPVLNTADLRIKTHPEHFGSPTSAAEHLSKMHSPYLSMLVASTLVCVFMCLPVCL